MEFLIFNSKKKLKKPILASSIILSGGKGTRFGREKSTVWLLDKTLIEWAISSVKELSSEILILAGENNNYPIFPEVKIFRDVFPGKGPMGGLYSGLKFCKEFWAFVLACDMPFVRPSLLNYFFEIRGGFDAVLALLNGGLQPFPGLYSKNCLNFLKEEIERNHLKLEKTISALKVRYVKEEEIRKFDPEMTSFFNINLPSDLNRALFFLKNKLV